MRCINDFEKSFDKFKFNDYADYNDILWIPIKCLVFPTNENTYMSNLKGQRMFYIRCKTVKF